MKGGVWCPIRITMFAQWEVLCLKFKTYDVNLELKIEIWCKLFPQLAGSHHRISSFVKHNKAHKDSPNLTFYLLLNPTNSDLLLWPMFISFHHLYSHFHTLKGTPQSTSPPFFWCQVSRWFRGCRGCNEAWPFFVASGSLLVCQGLLNIILQRAENYEYYDESTCLLWCLGVT